MKKMPMEAVMMPTTCPFQSRGYLSPYPTVVMVTMHHHIACGMEGNISDDAASSGFSRPVVPGISLYVVSSHVKPILPVTAGAAGMYVQLFVGVHDPSLSESAGVRRH